MDFLLFYKRFKTFGFATLNFYGQLPKLTEFEADVLFEKLLMEEDFQMDLKSAIEHALLQKAK